MTSTARSPVPLAMLALLAGLFLGACSHTAEFTPAEARCKFTIYPLENALPDQPDLGSILEGNPGDILLLSGGSQDGAFGAGFIDGWHETGTMPRFKLVTGISTGALQATGAFIGRPDIAVEGYTIQREGNILETYVTGSAVRDGFGPGAIASLLTRGSIADLIPLRDRLDDLLEPHILEAVGARYGPPGQGARLLVGATDVDLGTAVAFDMTEMAARYAAAPENSPLRARYKDCYIRALAASSIVPPAARPVFIDNRMYIDGGVRYAVFDDRLGDILDGMTPARSTTATDARTAGPPQPLPPPGPVAVPPTVPRLFMILNHTGESRAECNKIDEARCEPPDSTIGQRKDWEVLPLAVRTLELFENQVRRLSVERAEARALSQATPFFFARLRSQDMTDRRRRYRIPDFEGAETCTDWEAIDTETDDPVEFHRRYMRCLIEYGRERGRAGDWDYQPQQ